MVASLHCFCAYECTVTACKKCAAPIPEADKRRVLHDLCLPCKAAFIPDRSRFKAGDRVTMQASPNARRYHPEDPIRTGFTGTVESSIGRYLIGIRDDGREWCEQPAVLDPAAQAKAAPKAEQLSLWEAA